jgi:hypothetical protein
MQLEVENSVASFLGVHMERNQSDGSIKLTQVGLIKRIIAALGIEYEHMVHTPTGLTPLTKESEGEPPGRVVQLRQFNRDVGLFAKQ